FFLFQRALTLAHLGRHADAAAAAEPLLAPKAPARFVYGVACVFALCAAAAARDDKLEPAEGERAAEADAARAGAPLGQAVQAGYRDVNQLKKDPDLDPLRRREDFQKLLAELEREKKH